MPYSIWSHNQTPLPNFYIYDPSRIKFYTTNLHTMLFNMLVSRDSRLRECRIFVTGMNDINIRVTP
jgi:hypothetical protein